MIGNWVEYEVYPNKRAGRQYVVGISGNEVFLECAANRGKYPDIVKYENIFGIPITEELLDKMGDKIRNGLKCGDAIIRFSKGKATVRPIVGFGEITGLRYLHELQNAYFMLTKKQLEIRL